MATRAEVIETAEGAAVQDIKTGFRAACRRAGLAGVTPHVLRHTAATWMASRRVPMRDSALFLGRGNTAMVEKVYAKHTPDWLAEAAGALALPGPSGTGNPRGPRKKNE